ncbi:hypothetical protein KIPE111705_17785 [Kibdelosporangium persicum]|uniref:Uncharacterized protein n=1 Tax=Kibdelosporangium persicum TaxID=2698649 RepID=A0ABX2F747_9PSEU|nr:hypothetical protein [Kibdelosporangium persicum]NRN66615.1 hypothetical protein [Kibdelosporangium persicum]
MNGIQIDTWIKLESCDITFSIVDGMAELQFGGRLDGLSVTATEKGLVTLVTKATEALQAIRAASDGKI